MTLEEEVALLRTENQELREELAAVQERIAELERVRKGPPTFVKANRPRGGQEQKPRRKRGAEQNGSRKREKPTADEARARTSAACLAHRGARQSDSARR